MMKRILFLGLPLFFLSTAFSKTIYVDNSANGNNNGRSWRNAFKDLQDALDDANDGDNIWIAEGVYTPGNSETDMYRMKNGVSLYGGFSGNEKALNERNFFEHKTVLSGEIGTTSKEDNINTILRFNKLDKRIDISGITISNGYANGIIGIIEINSSAPIFSFCVIENNENHGSLASGGAVTITGFDGPAKPQFVNCIFRNNFSAELGGAVHAGSDSGNQSIFANCLFDGNTSDRGAALHNGQGVIATFNCTFVNNMADKGSTSYATGGTATQHINAIIWDNNSSPVMNIRPTVTTTVGYSIIRGGYTGTGNMDEDPEFISSTDFRLSENSPARDAGSPAVDPADLPQLDLAGGNRLTFSKLDLGAYEYQCAVQGTEITETTCDEYVTDKGNTITESGVYTERYFTKNGCDSIVTYDLTITKAKNTITETSCEPITINDETYNESGTYVQTLTTSKGCDSVLTLELSITNINENLRVDGNTLSARTNDASYQWLDCDNNNSPIDGETNVSFTPSEDGNYAVEITKNGCTKISECVEVKPSSIAELTVENIEIYPIPATKQIQVALELIEDKNYEILSLQGKVIKAGLLQSKISSIDISELRKGLYFIKIENQLLRFSKN